jgi:hypothetical protein
MGMCCKEQIYGNNYGKISSRHTTQIFIIIICITEPMCFYLKYLHDTWLYSNENLESQIIYIITHHMINFRGMGSTTH